MMPELCNDRFTVRWVGVRDAAIYLAVNDGFGAEVTIYLPSPDEPVETMRTAHMQAVDVVCVLLDVDVSAAARLILAAQVLSGGGG